MGDFFLILHETSQSMSCRLAKNNQMMPWMFFSLLKETLELTQPPEFHRMQEWRFETKRSEVHGRHEWHGMAWILEKSVKEATKHVQQTLQDVLFRRLALCITCPHFQVPWDWEGSNHALQGAPFIAVEKSCVAGGWEDTILLEHGNLAAMGWGLTGITLALRLETTNQNTNTWPVLQREALWSIQACWFRGGDQILHRSHNTSSFATVKESTVPRTTSWNWSMRTARRAVLMVGSISGLSKKGLVFPYRNELVCFHFGYQDVQCWVLYR